MRATLVPTNILRNFYCIVVCLASMAQVRDVVPDEACWMGELQFNTCCLPPPHGNIRCWDDVFTYQRCCVGDAREQTGVDINEVEDISTLGGCELNIFQEFKARAGAWYRQHKPNLVLFQELGYLMGRFDNVYRSCAPAALTAMLLTLEAKYFEDEIRWQELYGLYVERQHEAVATGRLLESHHANGWPLVEGIQKVNALRSIGQGIRLKGDRYSAIRPTLNIVVCYCGRDERVDWLSGLASLPWRSDDRSAHIGKFVDLLFYHKCGADKEQERIIEESGLIAKWSSTFRKVGVRYVDDALRADDCSAYLAYIVDYYHELPEYTVFLHADAPEHIPTIDLLVDVVFAASRGYLDPGIGFLHLAHNYVAHDLGANSARSTHGKQPSEEFEFSRLWRNVFDSSVTPSLAAGHVNAYCCVQFLVRRERILLRQRDFYARALTYFGETPQSYHALFPIGRVVWMPDTRGRTPCQLAMYIWHAIFGEELRLPRRHRDPRLPLFVRMLNIEVEAVIEAQAGADGADGSAIQFTHDRSNDVTYERLQSLFQ